MFRTFSAIRAIVAFAIALLITVIAYPASAGQASLAWNASSSSTVTGYKVHYGTASGAYSTHLDVGNALSATVPSLTSGSTYYFAVTAYNTAGESGYSNEAAATIPVAAPVASFTASTTSGTAPLAISFTSTSTGSISSTTWNFGDGTTGSGTSVSKTYNTAGTFTVTLTVTGAGGSTSKTTSVTVSTAAVAPVANFTATQGTGSAWLTESFASNSTGTNTTTAYLWTFHDGTTATGATASKTYGAAGTYAVTLKATNNPGGSNSISKSVTITAPAETPVANFTATQGTGSAWLTESFASNSTGTDTTTAYLWTFHDGTTATGATASKTYGAAGTYAVTLKATNNPGGSNSISKSVTITAPAETPVANFTATQGTGSAWLTESFASNSTGTNTATAYLWTFHDGTTATGATASKTYGAAGTYAVTLKATNNPGGSNSISKSVTITAPAETPVADFSASRVAGAVPLRIVFSDLSSGSADSYLWDFGDGMTSTDKYPVHTYRKPGSFTVKLTIKGAAGSQTKTRSAYVTAVAANDLVVDFGPSYGISSLRNGSYWSRMDSRSGRQLVMTDVDHNGDSDVVVDLGADSSGKSLGIWKLAKDGSWTQIDTRTAKNIVVGDLDGNGQDDLVLDFGSGTGLWLLANGKDLSRIDTRTAKSLLLADLGRDGRDELIADLGDGVGIWSYSPVNGWKQIDSRTGNWMLAADLDGNDQSDLVADFGAGNGVRARLNGGTNWVQIDSRTASSGAAVNPDGNQKEELALSYNSSTYPGVGIMLYSYSASTTSAATNLLQLSTQAANRMIAADLNSDGKQDLIVDFGTTGSSTGLHKFSLGAWSKINRKTNRNMVSGQFR